MMHRLSMRDGNIACMPLLTIRPPVIQLAIDLTSIDAALRLAEIGVSAGVDWLEAGTPLIARSGADAIGATGKAFPTHPVLAGHQTMATPGRNARQPAEHCTEGTTVRSR